MQVSGTSVAPTFRHWLLRRSHQLRLQIPIAHIVCLTTYYLDRFIFTFRRGAMEWVLDGDQLLLIDAAAPRVEPPYNV